MYNSTNMILIIQVEYTFFSHRIYKKRHIQVGIHVNLVDLSSVQQ